MVFSSLFRTIVRTVPRAIRTTRNIQPVTRSAPKNQFIQNIGEHHNYLGESTPLHTLSHPTKTAVKEVSVTRGFNPVVKTNVFRQTPATLQVQSTSAVGGNLTKIGRTQPSVFKSPIIQETGEGVTFRRRRPVVSMEGFGKSTFGAHKVPMRPDNAYLVRPKNPKDTQALIKQFRSIQNTQVSRLSHGTTQLESVRKGDVQNLLVRMGGQRQKLKNVATVSTARDKVLQKGDILFRRVGSNPKDKYVNGGVGDTFFITKDIPNAKFSLGSGSELGVQSTSASGGKLTNESIFKINKLRGKQEELADRFTGLFKINEGNPAKTKQLEKVFNRENFILEQKQRNIMGIERGNKQFSDTFFDGATKSKKDEILKLTTPSELGVQSTSARGGNLVTGTFDGINTRNALLVKPNNLKDSDAITSTLKTLQGVKSYNVRKLDRLSLLNTDIKLDRGTVKLSEIAKIRKSAHGEKVFDEGDILVARRFNARSMVTKEGDNYVRTDHGRANIFQFDKKIVREVKPIISSSKSTTAPPKSSYLGFNVKPLSKSTTAPPKSSYLGFNVKPLSMVEDLERSSSVFRGLTPKTKQSIAKFASKDNNREIGTKQLLVSLDSPLGAFMFKNAGTRLNTEQVAGLNQLIKSDIASQIVGRQRSFIEDTASRGGNLIRDKKIGRATFDQIDLGQGTVKLQLTPQNNQLFSSQVRTIFDNNLTIGQQKRIVGQAGVGKDEMTDLFSSGKIKLSKVKNDLVGGSEVVADIDTVAFHRVSSDIIPVGNARGIMRSRTPKDDLTEAMGGKPNLFAGYGLTARQSDQIISSKQSLTELGGLRPIRQGVWNNSNDPFPQKLAEDGFRDLFGKKETILNIKKIDPNTSPFKFLPFGKVKQKTGQTEGEIHNVLNDLADPVKKTKIMNHLGTVQFTPFAGKNIRTTGTQGAGLSDILRTVKQTKADKKFFENRGLPNFDDFF